MQATAINVPTTELGVMDRGTGQDDDLGSYKITRGVYEYDTNGILKGSLESSNGGWSSQTTRDEESIVTPRALYLEIFATLEMVFVVIRLQLWRVLVPYFPIRICAIMAFYAKILIVDLVDSFKWQTNFPRVHVNGHPTNILSS